MVYKKIGKNIKVIDRENSTIREIEEHFFRAGYSYCLLHIHLGCENDKKLNGLEKRIKKHCDFLK